MSLTRRQLLGLLGGAGHEDVALSGDRTVLSRLLSLLGDPDPSFPIVTP